MKFLNFSDIFLDKVVDIENKSFLKPWTKEMFLESKNNNCVIFKVLIVDEILIGYYVIDHFENEMEILRIAVCHKFRNKSFGKAMLTDILSVASIEKVKFIFLEVRKSNIIALKLYKIFGFKEIGVRKKYYKTEDALILKHCL
ncbi:MAG: ribosomal protein S18-alanine N-acetyltransferase [Endomicrobium sp.]|jgi:ribosomal-protein-alanine N-acetyltransferase|uniref:ribosomal protein S18-alanine N-acetyltransferase n=1 Tax=Candidatus Endomicrobiellum cubanum TaxID=3242325 RepID=UPI002822589B|nr:ribosomal protein S18-alanine N-acetyltransferase [Endomicrobium sp.]